MSNKIFYFIPVDERKMCYHTLLVGNGKIICLRYIIPPGLSSRIISYSNTFNCTRNIYKQNKCTLYRKASIRLT